MLRIYQNTNDVGRLRYEHALLRDLQRAGLSFSTPVPLATRGGETFVAMELGGLDVVAAIFPLIPGRHPERGNANHAAACGEALAELDGALARIQVDPTLLRLGTYGELDTVHPLVADPLAMVRQIAVSEAQQVRIRELLTDLLALIPDLYPRLPRQLIHSDYGVSNALVHGDRVSGILDFEFASPDLRAMDFTVGIWSFCLARDSIDPWPLVQAFTEGYRQRLALTDEEIAALPVLLRLREARSLVHWMGRHRQGLTTTRDIARRANDLLGLDAWLRANGKELVRVVEGAMR